LAEFVDAMTQPEFRVEIFHKRERIRA
jgi:hypothetical protein